MYISIGFLFLWRILIHYANVYRELMLLEHIKQVLGTTLVLAAVIVIRR